MAVGYVHVVIVFINLVKTIKLTWLYGSFEDWLYSSTEVVRLFLCSIASLFTVVATAYRTAPFITLSGKLIPIRIVLLKIDRQCHVQLLWAFIRLLKRFLMKTLHLN